MITRFLFFLVLPFQLAAQSFSKEEIVRWEKQAKQVTIIRDGYGIPHIYGKTDADAVFGLMYAQCEDDFKRIDLNYLEKLGELSIIKGESALYDDLLMRMIIDPEEAKADLKKAPDWLKKLCYAWADGINYYLYKHPNTGTLRGKPFEPWFPLLWTDGSIGAINTAGITVQDVANLYGEKKTVGKLANPETEEILTGSNGFAFSPKITESGNAILYINPHVTFYFRPEVHMVSDEGLNTYGAVTWGQFFVYQGFNEHCGWMHTSSGVDATDAYIEKITEKNGEKYYHYNNQTIRATIKKIVILCKMADNFYMDKEFYIPFTKHGPLMARKNDQWLSVRSDNRLMNGLIQCWERTKAKSFTDYKKTLDLKGNISNNTVYADAEGNIAYWHGNRVPARDNKYDWSKPVDGTTSATDWKGYHKVEETVHLINPVNGWLQNCNSTPYTVAGTNSPKKFTESGGENYPAYMAPDGENFRGLNAVRVLDEEKKYTLEKVIKAGYDTRLTAFEILLPVLIRSFEGEKERPNDSLFIERREAISELKKWDYRCSEQSIATTLAVEWGQRIMPMVNRTEVPGNEKADQVDKARYFVLNNARITYMTPFVNTIDDLKKRFGTWRIPWGEVNRFQRISSDIDNKFDDAKPSIPVGFVSSAWGMLPSYTSRSFPGTTKRYGVNGNSFICAVEFGKKIKAKSLLAGGESGDPNSPHFFDQGKMYSKGEFKDVLFYKEDVLKQAKRTYHPGE
ncbi:MAG TPA: penicillin acylase family protein [Chitinophagaceae bacterium]|jgi:acyl-homoserine lactone acylase PvdQ|nr:penicillin acylase family protein [Chitinophagaceae bacterium]